MRSYDKTQKMCIIPWKILLIVSLTNFIVCIIHTSESNVQLEKKKKMLYVCVCVLLEESINICWIF